MGIQDSGANLTTMTNPSELSSQETPNMSRKRKNTADEAQSERTIKHRSSQACQSCRARKVRCDVVANGSRCTNCRLDKMECVVVASRRGKSNQSKSNHTHRDNATKVMKPHPPQAPRPSSEPSPMTSRSSHKAMPTPMSPGDADHVPACVTFDEDLDKARSDQQPTPDPTVRRASEHAQLEVYDGLLSPEAGTNTLNQDQSPAGKITLPAFIIPMSSRISSEDFEFLAQRGALILPDHDLRVEILQAYLFSVHPFMPMLNFRAFLHSVSNNREDNRVSLLLFQAVMFAGLHSLQLDVIHRLGFGSVKEARKVFFNRVKLLYEFDIETDSAAVFQSLVLMSLWYGKWDDRRHTWHWTGLAYDAARNMGLHREPTMRYGSEKVRRFRRRAWWSLYIRDRMIALGTRRPMRIRDDDFDVAMLTLDDFDLESLEDAHGRPLVSSVDENTSTALMCIQLAKLCVSIGHVVSSQYTVLSTHQDVPHTMMVVSKRGENSRELESCDRELNEWFQGLDSSLRRNNPPTPRTGYQSLSEVHWAILNITYLTVVNVLHRAQALQPVPDDSEALVVQNLSKSKVKDAARSLTKFSQTMLQHDQVRFLGPIGVTALNAASLSHMLDISSGNEDVRDASTFRLYQSLQVLQALRGVYASADASASFLASVTRKAGIPVPAQIAAPAGDSVEDFVMPLTSGKSSAWSSYPGVRWEQPEAVDQNWQAAFQNPPQVASNVPLLDEDRQALLTGMMQPRANPSTMAFTAKGPSLPSHGTAIDGPFMDWNGTMDAGMDLDSMAFNHDFYSDAFGFNFLPTAVGGNDAGIS